MDPFAPITVANYDYSVVLAFPTGALMPATSIYRKDDSIEVELFGVPRLITGQRSVRVTAQTLGEVAQELGRVYPVLLGKVIDRSDLWLLNGYTFVVGDTFTRDRETAVEGSVAVLLVSSVAGG
jgi:molybdopterin converting factor small subunit